MLLTGIKTS